MIRTLRIYSLVYLLILLKYSWFYNAVSASGVQQSVLYINIYIYQILFPYKLLSNIEYISLWFTVGPCWLYILCIIQHMCVLYITLYICYSKIPDLSLPSPSLFGNLKFVSMSVSLYFVNKFMKWKVLFEPNWGLFGNSHSERSKNCFSEPKNKFGAKEQLYKVLRQRAVH